MQLAEFGALYAQLRAAPTFVNSLDQELVRFAGRPTPLIHATRYSAHSGGAQIYLKLEDRAPADVHRRVVCIGEAFIARALRRKRMVAGVRSLATAHWLAAAGARFGLAVEIHADPALLQKQATAVQRLKLFGAVIHEARASDHAGDIRNAALKVWLADPNGTFLSLGLDAGPDPYGIMLRDLTGVIGRESRRQLATLLAGKAPDVVVTRGGENAEALSLFPAFLADPARLVCVEAEPPRGNDDPFAPQPTLTQQMRINAILEGSEYATLARERAELKAADRVEYVQGRALLAQRARQELARLEGVICGEDSAYAVAWAAATAKTLAPDGAVLVLLAERPTQELKVG